MEYLVILTIPLHAPTRGSIRLLGRISESSEVYTVVIGDGSLVGLEHYQCEYYVLCNHLRISSFLLKLSLVPFHPYCMNCFIVKHSENLSLQCSTLGISLDASM